MNLSELMTYTRQRTGTESNQTIQDSELITLLNKSLGHLDLILCTDYEDYHMTTFLATLGGAGPNSQAPNNMIPCPPDFFKLRAVDFGSPGGWITIFGYGLQQRNRFNNPYSNMFANYGNQVARRVRVMDHYIVIEPQYLCSGNYQIWYTPKFQELSLGTDNLPYDMDTEGFIEYAVASAGIKIYQKLLLDTSSFERQAAQYEELVRNGAKNRMSNGPKSMQNVRNRGGGWGWGRGGFGMQ